MKFDLKGMSRKQLEKLRGDVDKALAKLETAEKKAALAAVEKAAKAHGYSLADLTDGKAPTTVPAAKKTTRKRTGSRAKVPPKYRNPDNADETWAGCGRKPKWVETHLAAGGDLDQIAI